LRAIGMSLAATPETAPLVKRDLACPNGTGVHLGGAVSSRYQSMSYECGTSQEVAGAEP